MTEEIFVKVVALLVDLYIGFYLVWGWYLAVQTLVRVAHTNHDDKGAMHLLGLPLVVSWVAVDYALGVVIGSVLFLEIPVRGRIALTDKLRYHAGNVAGWRTRLATFLLKLITPFSIG